MPATSQISTPQLDDTATLDEGATRMDDTTTLDETVTHVSASCPRVSTRVPQGSSAVQANSNSSADKSLSQDMNLSQNTSVSQDQSTSLSQGQSTSVQQHTEPLSSEAQLAPTTTIMKNFARYVHENPAQTLCGVLATIAVLLLVSSLTSIDNRFAEVNTRFNTINTSIDNRFTEVDNKIENLRKDMNAGFNTINDKFVEVNVKLAVLITALNLDTTVEAAEQGTFTGTHS